MADTETKSIDISELRVTLEARLFEIDKEIVDAQRSRSDLNNRIRNLRVELAEVARLLKALDGRKPRTKK